MPAIAAWVREEIGGPKLGDTRRDERLLRLITGAAERPCGRVSNTFQNAAERQAAYDFLEHSSVSTERVMQAVRTAAARQCSAYDEVLVPLDGSSLSLTDTRRAKGFGAVGSRTLGGRGLKVISALALTPDGTPLGLLAQKWWVRGRRAPKKSKVRKLKQRESYRWHEAIELAEGTAKEVAPKTRLHFLIDREGDASLLLQRLAQGGHAFTVRANGTRNVLDARGKRVNVQKMLRKAPGDTYVLDVPAKSGQVARRAIMQLRYASVRLVMRDRHTHKRETLALSVVWAREVGHTRSRLDWMLYSTAPVVSADDAQATVKRYTLRWRIEDFHRAWKRGGCSVEETQLRSKDAVIKWATILSVVATRAERLKHLSRKTPEIPASTELSGYEIEALILLKRQQKKRNEKVPSTMPTLGQAVRWIADLGSYIGPKNGAPGATVIARGLESLAPAAHLVRALHESGRLR